MDLERIVHNIKWEGMGPFISAIFDFDSAFRRELKEHKGFKKSLKTLDASLFKRSKLSRILNDAFGGGINFSLETDGVFEVASGPNKIGALAFSDAGYEVKYSGLIGPGQEAAGSHCATDLIKDDASLPLNDIYSMAVLHFNLQKLGNIPNPQAQQKILDVFDSSHEISASYVDPLVNLAKIAEKVSSKRFGEIVGGLGEYIASYWAVYSLYEVTRHKYLGLHMDLQMDLEGLDWDLLVKTATLPDRIQRRRMDLKNPVELKHPEVDERGLPGFSPVNIIYNLDNLKDVPPEIRKRTTEIFRCGLAKAFYSGRYSCSAAGHVTGRFR